MFARIVRIAFLTLMILNGLFFVVNIYVLGNQSAAIAMHDDLGPDASPLMANVKVLDCFFTGILYIVAAYGIWRKQRPLMLAGIAAFGMFDGLYLVELSKWSHPGVWWGFGLFGGLSFLYGLFSWRSWRGQGMQPAQQVAA